MKRPPIFALLASWAVPAFAQSVDAAWVRRCNPEDYTGWDIARMSIDSQARRTDALQQQPGWAYQPNLPKERG